MFSCFNTFHASCTVLPTFWGQKKCWSVLSDLFNQSLFTDYLNAPDLEKGHRDRYNSFCEFYVGMQVCWRGSVMGIFFPSRVVCTALSGYFCPTE